MKKQFIYLATFLILISCQTVSKKVDETITKEEKELSKWLNQSEDNLKIEFGNPDKIDFKDGSRNRFYIYISKKYKIKCERIFEINPNNIVIGFKSKNCF
tara:strand:- start:835 stop:1134 length:300 start_codon:yes stop_codon:yes gene_type:complete